MDMSRLHMQMWFFLMDNIVWETFYSLSEKSKKMDVIIFNFNFIYLFCIIFLYLCKVEHKERNLVIIFGQKIIRVVKVQEDSLNSRIR